MKRNYVDNRCLGSIRIEDIVELRASLKIGDTVTEEIFLDKLGDRLIKPRRVWRRIIGIYPHLVRLESFPGEPVKTMTYVEMLMERIRTAEG